MLPINLVLVRHGESVGNVATHASKSGDHSHYTADFTRRHSSQWELTPTGQQQTHIAGVWLKDNGLESFDRYYVSEYRRARQTAGLLDLPDARWYSDMYLTERNWGEFDVLSRHDMKARFEQSLAIRKSDPFFWTPPNGERYVEVCIRVDRFLDTLHRECSDKNVIVVCHGEVMWAFRVRLERMSVERFIELDASTDPHDRINNCQIIQYSRLPLAETHYHRMRSVCPWDLSISGDEWQPISRNHLTNSQLLE